MADPTRQATTRARRDTGASGYPTAARAALAAQALDRLVAAYDPARWTAWSVKDPLSMLIDIVLSHRTRNEQTAATYAALRARFDGWEAVRDAPVAAVEAAIAPVNWPELKAPRIQALLRRITAERGALSLDFLCDLPVAEGAAWLGRLEGVGPKTVACVLLFSCRKPILPVDTHVHRVAIRLGLIGAKVTAEAAHPLLQALLPDDAQTIYDFHRAYMKHGQRVCVYDRPRCHACALTDLCDYYQAVVRPEAEVTGGDRGAG
jgi:endonuclease-3